jgi:hypothetical protein
MSKGAVILAVLIWVTMFLGAGLVLLGNHIAGMVF